MRRYKTIESVCTGCGRTWRTHVRLPKGMEHHAGIKRYVVSPEACSNCRETRRLLSCGCPRPGGKGGGK